MKICAIQNCNFTPVFTSKDRVFAITSKADYFEVSQEQVKFNRLCDDIETTLGIVDETDVSQMAKQVSRATNVDIKEVYKIMLTLSEYSSIKSLKQFENYLKDNDFRVVSNILPYYNNPEITTPPCLSNVLHYISLSNFDFHSDTNSSKNFKKALVIDSNLLEMLKNMPLQEYEQFKKDILQNKNVELFYIENFENGYNFLNQGKSFEQFTIDMLNKAKILQKQNGKSIEENIHNILNQNNYRDMDALGIYSTIINREYENLDEKSIATQIKENLNPPMPSRKELYTIIDNALFHRMMTKDFYLDFLNQTMEFISPRQYAKYLQDMHSKIDQYLIDQNKPLNRVYYLIPANNKSYMLANYEYFKVNNIKNPKVLYFTKDNYSDYEFCKNSENLDRLNSLPENSTVIVLDDCAMTGLSYTEERFLYRAFAKKLNKSLDIVFAPMITTPKAKNLIDSCIKDAGRENNDIIIYSKELPIVKELYDPTTSVIFPYMGPDTNYDNLIELYEQFLYTPAAQKPSIGDIAKESFYFPIQK